MCQRANATLMYTSIISAHDRRGGNGNNPSLSGINIKQLTEYERYNHLRHNRAQSTLY